ncbi:FhuF 2Fe-2S C-terminal domain-containing protein [Amycolatopsis pretoriensis]|uniref:FhuF 2Fe-2S C-terminal domain-containing protein n=1 Tax=Amycolatopsis pretoriensis TaxID=218821 RepID=A0A1H5RDB2_9PSEU|nr:(2Fe-2S)-binding protein [Amycolatopsis pretoriensis]SEF35598.1 FhuF 2Fe-2S C-terminal domain-containing protein [Amycolatopsis pretoriensis]
MKPDWTAPATLLADPEWVRARIGGAAKLYGCAAPEVLGTIWWYSLSSVLVAPALEGLVAGAPADPSLDAVEIDLLADGRFLGARSTRPLAGGLPELGAAFGEALGTAIATIADVTGARARALGAIATDSIGNRLLWTPDPERAMALAEPLVAAIGLDLPKPRFVRVGRTPAVRRASCCLIYEVGNPKCVSCPRQTPAERDARLRAALG